MPAFRVNRCAFALLVAAGIGWGCDPRDPRHPRQASARPGGASALVDPQGGAGGSSGEGGYGSATGGASGSEAVCYDGADQDGDGLVDCDDPDCAASCESPCSAPVELPDPAFVRGSTLSRADEVTASCGVNGAPDAVFAIVAARAGVLEVDVGGDEARVMIRTDCPGGEELACTDGSASVPVEAGARLVLVVEADTGFTLDARTRAPGCGDGVRDEGEQCDDGNTFDADGCDSSCALISSEQAGNDVREGADTYPDSDIYFGSIEPAGDADFVAVTIDAPATRLVAYTFDFGDAACERGLLDSTLELWGADGEQPLSADDDGGTGACSRLISAPLEPGVYALRVAASGTTATFPYVLLVDESVCGDGVATAGETCDDGGVAAGDGCSESCALE